MQRFMQFRLGSHRLPIVVDRFAGGQHVARADRVCTYSDGVAVAQKRTSWCRCSWEAKEHTDAELARELDIQNQAATDSHAEIKSVLIVLLSSRLDLGRLLYVIALLAG